MQSGDKFHEKEGAFVEKLYEPIDLKEVTVKTKYAEILQSMDAVYPSSTV